MASPTHLRMPLSAGDHEGDDSMDDGSDDGSSEGLPGELLDGDDSMDDGDTEVPCDSSLSLSA